MRGKLLLVLLLFAMLCIWFLPSEIYADSRCEVFQEAYAADKTKLVFIGDSRTVHMHRDIGDAEASRSSWSAMSGKGYYWMISTGVPAAERMMKKGDSVVLCMGVNSVTAGERTKYPAFVNKKAGEWAKKGISTYFVSVNPVEDEKKIRQNSPKRNAQVIAFNNMMKAELSEQVTYIDTYSSLIGDFTTTDGTHYPPEINARVYRLIVSFVKDDRDKKPVCVVFHRNQTAADRRTVRKTFYTGRSYPAGSVSWHRKGYELTGWASSSGAAVPEIAINEMVSSPWLESQPAQVHLYAVWKKVPLSCSITFMRNTSPGDRVYSTQTFQEGKNQRITDKGWTREGYVLAGWSSVPNTVRLGYSLYSTFTDYWIRKNSDGYTLYAVWRKKR